MLRLLLVAIVRVERITQQNVLNVARMLSNQERELWHPLWTLSDSRDKLEFLDGMEYSLK